MKLAVSVLAPLAVPLLAFGFVACAAGQAPPGPTRELLRATLDPASTFCPAGFTLDTEHQLCASAAEVVGPFAGSMTEFCKRFVASRSDGTNSCETAVDGRVSTRWVRQLAFDARTSTLQGDGCAQSTSLDSATGYCSDGDNVYGPFSLDDVAFCKAAQGGSTCETNRVAPVMVRRKASGFSAANEITVANRGASIGKLVIAIGVAEGTLHADGTATPAYFGNMDSGIPNIGLWSCTVCGNRSAADADQFYYDNVIAPHVADYEQAAGSLANHPMVAAAFFGLLVQSPDATLNNANASDLALITMLARGQLAAPVSEAALLDLLVRAWTVHGVMQWRSPDTGANDPAAGRADQLRRLRAYADALNANGVTPYP